MTTHPLKFDLQFNPALLDGTKTQHRVLLDPQPPEEFYQSLGRTSEGWVWSNMQHANPCEPECCYEIKCPHQIGDRFTVNGVDFEITNIRIEIDDGQWVWVYEFKKVG